MNEINSLIEPTKAFYELILDGVVITNLSGKISYVNNAACVIMHCENKNNLKNQSIKDSFTDPDYFEEMTRNLATKKSLVTTNTCKRKDGVEGTFVLSFSLLQNENEVPIGIQIIFKNPLVLNDEQQYFEKKSAMLGSLNNQTREIVIISDCIEKKNIFCSRSVEKITGWSQKDFIDGGWAFAMSLTHPEDSKAIAKQFSAEMNLRKKGKTDHDHKPIIYEYRKRHKNGNWINVLSESLILERDEELNPKYLITFLKDVSHKKDSNKTDEAVDKRITEEIEELIVPGKTRIKYSSVILSKREKEILQLVRDGMSTKEIADILNIKITSVNSYRKNLMTKMNARNTAELVQKSNQIILN
ncbi:MAG: helix-turn-helix transcriptional regulator [Bacteroidota bacterium]